MDIWRAAEVLNQRKWLIVLSVVIALVLTFGATRLTGSRWVATVRLMSPETSSLASPGNGEQARSTEEERKTLEAMYAAVVTSREVLEPAYNQVKEALPSGTSVFEDIEFEATGPRLYDLRIYNSSPFRAEQIANALADSFVQRNRSLNTQQSEKLVSLLKEQLRQADADLAKASARYRDYSRKNRVLGNPTDESRVAMSEIEAARTKRNQITQDMAAAAARLSYTEQKLAEAKAAVSTPRPILLGPRAQSLSLELDKVETSLAMLQTRYGSEYPQIKEALATRNELKAQFKAAQQEEAQVIAWDKKDAERIALEQQLAELKPKVSELQAQETTLNATILNAETWIQRAKALGDPFGSLSSEVNALSETRAQLVSRLNAANMALDVTQRQNPIVILSRVNGLNPPINVTAGRTKKLLVLAVLCAVIGTSTVIIALDSIDRRLKTVYQVEQFLPARVLATIPQPEHSMSYVALARVAEMEPRSLPAEAYRFLGLHLLSVAGPQARSLMVLSAKAEQGSTTTITNLAITLAQAGNRVVLVDANIRTPELHQVFSERNDFGFTDLLMDPTSSSFERALRSTTVQNLNVIYSGPAPQNPWELFRSENLSAVADRLRSMADYVLYDTPSGTLFTDALNLAPVVDAAFLCIRALEAPTGAEQRLLEMVDQSSVNVLGAVLSHVPVSMVAGYDNYQHYYTPALNALNAPSAADGGMVPAGAAALSEQSQPRFPQEGMENRRGNRGDFYEQDSEREM